MILIASLSLSAMLGNSAMASNSMVLCFTLSRTAAAHFFTANGVCPKNSVHETTNFNSISAIATYLDEVSKGEFNLGLQNGLAAGYGAGNFENH